MNDDNPRSALGDGLTMDDSQGAAGAPRHRVLVVDDNVDGAESMTFLLNAMGQDVSVAYDGEQALEQFQSFRPDVVLMDIGLPRLSGYDAARSIRQMPGGAEILLVALTGWGLDEDRRQALEAGFDHHWVKPVDFSVLREVLGIRA